MKDTIRLDKVGRTVIPKSIRDIVGIKSGEPLDIFIRNGHIEIHRFGVDDEWDDIKRGFGGTE